MNFFDARLPVILSAALILTACGSDSDNTIANPEDGQTESGETETGGEAGISLKLLPAASETVYLNLETGALVEESDAWHIAANRLAFELNGGASGSGKVGGTLAVAQEDFYEDSGEPNVSVFTNATENSEEEHLLGIFQEPDAWQQDAFASAFGSSDTWSHYDHDTGLITEKDDVGYLVRSAEGDSYARMRVVDFSFPTREGNGIDSFTFEFDVQAADETQFSSEPVVFEAPADFDGMQACYDFDAAAVVDCGTSEVWDVLVGFSGRDWFLKTNSGTSGSGQGGASDPMGWDELADNDADPGYDRIYSPDSTGGVFADNTWYAYSLNGGHKIWPNFRTFLIKSDIEDPESTVWALQIVGYYDESGNSGQPTVRWLSVEPEQNQE
jgi:hypothetical protein